MRVRVIADWYYWDFDNPDHALPYRINEAMRRGFFRENARTVYRQ